MISLSKNFLIHCDIAEQYETQLNHTEIISAATVALYAEGLENQSIELSVAVSDDAEVRELNNSYRNVDNTTDVLSFAAEESQEDSNFALPPEAQEARYLGDIIISYPQAERQAPDFGNSTTREVQELVIHGIFHLLGYDHEKDADREVMRAKEEAAATILDGK
ncbi:MAG: rRNA maturation RNase YbeY [Chloroflexi bacterium]|uniref:Endoribonuclease YbeY n=1 Tax=Candidatus Chlorohelix allophototropha TaxID=3003348 RepID=A0A8T7LUA0_9CHLR|nr:rRNA maturation RNase YbeY [Chloroflexota bacterium]WJW67467.1 rRNA maturation RNase YbeY [Chloroflexota bacterium L227-S17]